MGSFVGAALVAALRTAQRCSAGVPPTVAGASRPGGRAEAVLRGVKERPRHSRRDARATILKPEGTYYG